MNLLIIAAIAYALNAAYTLASRGESPPNWNDLTDEQRQGYVDGVNFILENLDAGPAAQHERWLEDKTADGWVFGEVKDEENKTDPNLIAFDNLPFEMRARDIVIFSIVSELSKVEPPQPVVVNSAPASFDGNTAVPNGYTPIKYIGKRENYTDNMYGTHINFTKGQTELIQSDKAKLMLRHPDQYVLGEVEDAPEPVAAIVPKKDKVNDNDTEQELQEARDLVANMDLEALHAYAATNFAGHKLHPRAGVEKARIKVTELIDQYGLK